MAVRTFLSKFTAYGRANGRMDDVSLAQLENQVTEPASVVFWNLGQAGGDYTIPEACATLESACGTSDPEKRSGQSSTAGGISGRESADSLF